MSSKVLEEGYLDDFMNKITPYFVFDTQIMSEDIQSLHLHPDKIFNKGKGSKIIITLYIQGLHNLLERNDSSGYEFIRRTLGFNYVQCLIQEYLNYPLDDDNQILAESISKLLSIISGLEDITWMNKLLNE